MNSRERVLNCLARNTSAFYQQPLCRSTIKTSQSKPFDLQQKAATAPCIWSHIVTVRPSASFFLSGDVHNDGKTGDAKWLEHNLNLKN